MDLFEHSLQEHISREAPLAARMRPRTMDEFIGQDHIVGPGRLLRRAIQADQLSSLIFYGPPGTGKTTLAMVIANTTKSHFISINAVLSGVKDIRNAIAEAKERRGMYNQRTILFVDEVHRWNKAQQDALLPWVENGTVILVGATTENPYFSVNRPLVSRSRIFQLKPLVGGDLEQIALAALSDEERGYGGWNVDLQEDARSHLVNVANGDARSLLNALELAVETTPPDSDEVIVIDMTVAEESIQRRAVLYDKEGDVHFDTISAFIKSLRGSDPDAAMYWLAKMVYAGEDPRFVFRRMLIFAGEDVGLADPQAMGVVVACAEAFERVGLPEGRFPLAEAALYLATAPKSNSVFAFFDALSAVESEREAEVPAHLRDASRDKEGFGHGEGYLYPHAFRDHWVAQQYLPPALQGKIFYEPSDQGHEITIRENVARQREAQLASMAESSSQGPLEILTSSPRNRQRDLWLQRTIGETAGQLGELRDRVLDSARLQRHHTVLDVNAGTGLLTWDAVRRVPEGGVWAIARDDMIGETLRKQAERLPEVERPRVIVGDLAALPELLEATGDGSVRFDAIVGRNALGSLEDEDRRALAGYFSGLLQEGGVLSLSETIGRHTQRLYESVDLSSLCGDLARRVEEAEEAIYRNAEDHLVNWDVDDLTSLLDAAGLEQVKTTVYTAVSQVHLNAARLEDWFSLDEGRSRPSYAQHLLREVSLEELEQVRELFERTLTNRSIPWKSKYVHLTAASRE